MIYFITDWHSASLKSVTFFSTGAEILAAANAADCGLALTTIVRQFASAPKKVLFELTLDSRGTLDTMATLHEGRDFRLRPTVCRLRDAFSSDEINIMPRASGIKNITMATLHEGRDFRLRPTVCRLRDAFSSGEINIMRLAPGFKNIADASTRRNYAMFSHLNNICVTSTLPHHMFERGVK
jgi:hypothetical protein